MADDRWSQDLVMLKAIGSLEHEQNRPWLDDLVAKTGLDLADVKESLRRLKGEFVDLNAVGAWQEDVVRVIQVRLLPKARQEIGQWPSPEDTLRTVVEALLAAAEETEDPEQKSGLRKAARVVGRLSGDVATNLAATLIAKVSGMG